MEKRGTSETENNEKELASQAQTLLPSRALNVSLTELARLLGKAAARTAPREAHKITEEQQTHEP
ncbi:MAG: hypothetical protein RIC29_03995 [Rhodospirillaceae bacterium]